MLDFRIRTFIYVCKYMNFTLAAEKLHITQPAVSQHIHYLEELYNVKLFERVGKKIRLTAAGELLFLAVTTLKNDERVMVTKMKEQYSHKKTLIFGVTLTIGEYVIAAPLAHYLRKHPETDIHIKYANTAELLNSLKKGEINFALVEGYFKADEYDTLVYRSEEYIPVCSAFHNFNKDINDIEDLLSERLLVRENGSGTRGILEKILAVKNLAISDFAHIVEVESMHTIVRLLTEDCGIAFLYKAAVSQELDNKTLCCIPIKNFNITHNFTFLWNKGSVFSDNYKTICNELKNC